MRTHETPTPLLSITETAAYLRVSRATAYRLIERGELPALQVGGQLRIDPHELRAWLYACGTMLEPDLEERNR